MPRPKITEDTYDRLAELVDARTKVPAKHLTTDEKVAFLLDTLEDTTTRASRLQSKVKELEAELERARSAASDDTDDPPGIDEIASGSATNLPNGLGPNRR
jgi:uncharacterized protein YlxW (UPF0749 family)